LGIGDPAFYIIPWPFTLTTQRGKLAILLACDSKVRLATSFAINREA
jgi:hypothetical protein